MKVQFRLLIRSVLVLCVAGMISCGGCRKGESQQSEQTPATPTTPTTPPPASSNPNAVTLTLQPSQQFQTFEAWRATATGPYFLTPGGSSQLISPILLNQILDDLAFDLGLNGFRIELHHKQGIEVTNDNSDPFSLNPAAFDFAKPFQIGFNEPLIDPVARMQQVVLPLKGRVESRGELFSTYVSPIYSYTEFPPHWHNAEEYAELAEAYVLWSKNTFNFVPTYWAIVNEPETTFFGTGELARDVIAAGARLKARGFPTKIQTIETAIPDPSDLQGVVSNSTTVPHIGLISYHGYDYSGEDMPSFAGRNLIRDIARQRGLRTGMTEICCRGSWNGSYAQALGWARDIHWNLTEADASVWEPLSVMFACVGVGCTSGSGDPIAIDADLSKYYKFPAYYGLRQFAHYIRPGFKRLSIACTGCSSNSKTGQNIKPVAFQSPSGGLVVVIINDQTASQDIILTGLPGGNYEITGADPTATTGRTFPSQAVAAGQSLSLTFPPQAIITLSKR